MTDTPNFDESASNRTEPVLSADDGYDCSVKTALARMEKGFHLGGTHKLDRDALHDRKDAQGTNPD
jgi:hypothetical protein